MSETYNNIASNSEEYGAKGDLLVGSSPGNNGTLPVGSNGQILTADSAEPLGVKWAAAGATGANTDLSNLTSPTAINQDVLPDGDGTRDLGSTTKNWKAIYTQEIVIDPGTAANPSIRFSNEPATGFFHNLSQQIVVMVAGVTNTVASFANTHFDIYKGYVIRMYNSANTNYIGIKAPTSLSNYEISFPTAQGGSGTVLQNDGSGNLSWVSLNSAIETYLGEFYVIPQSLNIDAYNTGTDINIPNLSFATTDVRGAFIKYTVHRETDTTEVNEVGEMMIVYNNTTLTWDLSQSKSDDAQISFNITPAGQVRFSTTSIAGASHTGFITYTAQSLKNP